MDSTVTAAIIGLFGTVTAPIVTYFTTRPFEDKQKQKITPYQSQIISGKWEGNTKPEVGNYNSLDLFTVLNAVAKNKAVEGTFSIVYPQTTNVSSQEDKFKFQGGILYEQFLKINYNSTKKDRVQFGSIIFQLSQSGEDQLLSGRYVGYGEFSKMIVAGSIELKRVSD